MRTKMMIFFAVLLGVFFACKDRSQISDGSNNAGEDSIQISDGTSDTTDTYSDKEKIVLDTLKNRNILDINDSAKWFLYNIYYDFELPRSMVKNSSTKVYISYLHLRPVRCEFSNNGNFIDFVYAFIYDNKIVQNYPQDRNSTIAKGLRMEIKTKKIIFLTNGHGGTYTIGENKVDIRKINLDFVRKNFGKFDQWYQAALIYHGVK